MPSVPDIGRPPPGAETPPSLGSHERLGKDSPQPPKPTPEATPPKVAPYPAEGYAGSDGAADEELPQGDGGDDF